MTSTQSRAAAAALLLIALNTAPCQAQFGGGRGGGGRASRNVLLERTGGLSETTMRLVEDELTESLHRKNGEEHVGEVRALYTTPPKRVGKETYGAPEPLEIRALVVEIHVTDEPYDDALVKQRWDEARNMLEGALRSAQRRMLEREVNAYERKLALIRSGIDQTKREIEQAIHELEAMGIDGSPEQLNAQLDGVRTMLRELALNRVSAQARREAIELRIDELRKTAQEATDNDPLLAELERIEAIRERQLQATRDLNAAGQARISSLNDAETELARARVEVLKAKRAAMAEAEGGVLKELNNELSHLFVQLAEIDARTKALEASAADLRDATSVGSTAARDTRERRLAALQNRLAQLENDQAELEAQGPPVAEEIKITPLDEALSLGGENETGANESGGDGNAPQNE
jgi:hypothetical protein